MKETYKALTNQIQSEGIYSIVPIRSVDRYKIMKWRNEQIYHLRQNKLLTKDDQDGYFDVVIAKEFDHQQPSQILFSFLKENECIGYGGLVHINYKDRNAEISFLMDTTLEEKFFENLWVKYLSLIQKVAFEGLKLHKIFTYAFDVRPRLYVALLQAGFYKEAQLKEHCIFEEKYIDVIIHSKINNDASY